MEPLQTTHARVHTYLKSKLQEKPSHLLSPTPTAMYVLCSHYAMMKSSYVLLFCVQAGFQLQIFAAIFRGIWYSIFNQLQ